MKNRLCIASPNLAAYSETFIRDQINYLQPDFLIYHGNYPVKSKAGDWKLSFPFNVTLIRGIVRRIFPRLFHISYTNSLAAYLVKHKVGILLANYGPVGVSVVDACQKAGVRLIVHFHGFDAYAFGTIAKYQHAYKNMFSVAERIVAVSTEMREELIKLGAAPGKVVFIPYGINQEKFTSTDPAANGPLLVNIGRFTPKKAPDLLIKAFRIVKDAVPDARLVMVGEGELFEEAKTLAASLHLSDDITFTGVQTSEQIVTLLHQARIYVQHSLRPASGDSEGTPVSILEACACGLPVVSTRHAGIKDAVINGQTGWLVAEGDYKGMAEKIIELLKDPATCRRMGEASRKWMAEAYDFKSQMKKLEEFIKV
ncbi:Glycosyltransferase involved in cell wall bisynthesis [Chitinophaga terrae (ex Kim and Jung 2007)]|uniref:Glycosyltransferase involved in cell wall bisynthesis n=2 Tax=Chitinophaga terrae (ex Kim and Jung 2007) TaxID=408074 RepID=A0A1H4GJA6_9BACT|nr:Glycosyltransferase involved in cell wall bisynthesis [Chitinophaga terrae (ex Kim and Jung 2007)]